MADAFSQIYLQIVFAVKNRESMIQPVFEEKLHKYITGIAQGQGHKMLAIGGMPDHIHLFIGMNPSQAVSDLVREIKKSSTKFINEQKLSKYTFSWQAGYGVFSYSRSHRDTVCNYILNQKSHHKKKSFEEEYRKLLKDFEIEIGRKEMFNFFE